MKLNRAMNSAALLENLHYWSWHDVVVLLIISTSKFFNKIGILPSTYFFTCNHDLVMLLVLYSSATCGTGATSARAGLCASAYAHMRRRGIRPLPSASVFGLHDAFSSSCCCCCFFLLLPLLLPLVTLPIFQTAACAGAGGAACWWRCLLVVLPADGTACWCLALIVRLISAAEYIGIVEAVSLCYSSVLIEMI